MATTTHWNGRRWSLVATPNPAGPASGDLNDLNSVRCTSPANCWAVGVSKANGQPARNQALHWNGSTWSVR